MWFFLYRWYDAVPYLFLSLGLHTETICLCFQSWCGWVSMLISTDQHSHCTEKLVFPRKLQNELLFNTNLNCDLRLFPVSASFQPLMCFYVFFSKWLRQLCVIHGVVANVYHFTFHIKINTIKKKTIVHMMLLSISSNKVWLTLLHSYWRHPEWLLQESRWSVICLSTHGEVDENPTFWVCTQIVSFISIFTPLFLNK